MNFPQKYGLDCVYFVWEAAKSYMKVWRSKGFTTSGPQLSPTHVIVMQCYISVTSVLHRCYISVTSVLHRCYISVTSVLHWCYISVTSHQTKPRGGHQCWDYFVEQWTRWCADGFVTTLWWLSGTISWRNKQNIGSMKFVFKISWRNNIDDRPIDIRVQLLHFLKELTSFNCVTIWGGTNFDAKH